MLFTLLMAGIIAGLIQYFVDFKGLRLYEPPAANADSSSFEETPELTRFQKFIKSVGPFYKFLQDHWQFIGYNVTGIAGALLTPLIKELTGDRLPGFDKIIVGPVDSWHYLILLGYGIIFGYSSVRIIRSIGSLVMGNFALKQEQQQKKIENAQTQIKELKDQQNRLAIPQRQLEELSTKLAALTTQVSKPAAFNLADSFEDSNVTTGVYFDGGQNEIDKQSYYRTIDINNTGNLFDDLHKLLEKSHTTKLPYQPSLHLYPTVDRHPDGSLRSIYSGSPFSLTTILALDENVDKARAAALSALSSFAGGDSEAQRGHVEDSLPYNCEHVVPQSWFNKEAIMKGDLHHLFTCETNCNGFRGNNPYFDFPDYGTNFANIIEDECGKSERGVFEPDKNKGIVARAVLYFLVRYPGKTSPPRGYNAAGLQMLVKWHKDNAVSPYEKHRNQAIYKVQGNRNPFIDFPELADKIDFKVSSEAITMETWDLQTPNSGDDDLAFAELNKASGFDQCDENPNSKPWKDWRTAESLKMLLKQVNTMAPSRKKDSDGTIGDDAHQSRDSDHNPWVWDKVKKIGVVTAMDITNDPNNHCSCEILAKSLEVSKDQRIKYVIWDKKIMSSSPVDGAAAWVWRPYNGQNPHTKHIHISVKCEKENYDSVSEWLIKVV